MDPRKTVDIATQIINRKDPKSGESQLFVAAKTGDMEHIKLLLQYPSLDLDATRTPGDNKTASDIAEENGHKSIACLIRLQQLERLNPEVYLQIMADPCVHKILTPADQNAEVKINDEEPFLFWQFARTLRYIPDETLLLKFLKETTDRLSEPAQEQKAEYEINQTTKHADIKKWKDIHQFSLTASVKKQVEARKTWTDIVSAFYKKYHPAPQVEQKDDNFNLEKIKAGVIARLVGFGYAEKAEAIYHQCLNFLQYHTAIVISIDTSSLKKDGLSVYQLINFFERGRNADSGDSKDYRDKRENTERNLFQDLMPDIQARPRYGLLRLLDRNNVIEGVSGYGKSFVVLHDRIKLNVLFSPRDTYNAGKNKSTLRLCTFHDLEVLLSQSTDERLKAIAHRVTKGILPKDYKQHVHRTVRPEEYIEVLLPAVNILDPNMVQHIHISPLDYTLTGEDYAAFTKIGITVTNDNENPYQKLCLEFMQSVETNNVTAAEKLLKAYPSLLRITNYWGHHPVHIAAAKGWVDMVLLLTKNGVDINARTPQGKAPLHYAVENKHTELVCLLLSLSRMDTAILISVLENADAGTTGLILAQSDPTLANHKNDSGESALFIAAGKGDVEKIKLLLKFPGIDLDATRTPGDGKTASDIAEENGYKNIACLIQMQQLERLNPEVHLQIMADPCVQKILTPADQDAEVKINDEEPFLFWQYANTSKKIPDETLLIKFIKEKIKNLSKPFDEEKREAVVSPDIKKWIDIHKKSITEYGTEQIEGRRTWTDIVSATWVQNQNYIKQQDVRNKNIERLVKLGHAGNAEKIYDQCLHFLQYHSAIVVTMDFNFLKNETLSDFQLLNYFERGRSTAFSGDPAHYKDARSATEKIIFQGLDNELKASLRDLQKSPDLESRLEKNIYSRPCYAALRLLDENNFIEHLPGYGKSYIVLQGILKLNALFGPGNVHNLRVNSNIVLKMCTWHFMDVLLFQSTDARLNALVHRVTTGCLPADYKQYFGHPSEQFISVLLRGIDLVNPDMVQHIHVDPTEYKLNPDETAAFEDLGITVTNGANNPYPELCKRFMQAVEKNDRKTADQLLIDYPSLLRITNRLGHQPVHIAAAKGHVDLVELLIQHGADVNAKTPEDKTPLHYAIENRHKEMVKKLINMPRVNDVARPNSKGTLLMRAIEKSDAEITDIILQKYRADRSLLNYKKDTGESALFIAASLGEVEKIRCLLSCNGIDLEARRIPGDGKTALRIAEEKNHTTVVKMIIEAQYLWMKKYPDYINRKKNFDNLLPAEKDNFDRFLQMAYENYSYKQFEDLVNKLEARGFTKRNIVDNLKDIWPVNIRNLSLVLTPVELAVFFEKDRRLFLDFIAVAKEVRINKENFQMVFEESLPRISRLLGALQEVEICDFLNKFRKVLLEKINSSPEEMKSEQLACPLDIMLFLKGAPFLNKCMPFIATLSVSEIYFLLDINPGINNEVQMKQVVNLIYQVASYDQKCQLLKSCLKAPLFFTKVTVQEQAQLVAHAFSKVKIKEDAAVTTCLAKLKNYVETETDQRRVLQAASAMYELINDTIDNNQILAISTAARGSKKPLGGSKIADYLDEYLLKKGSLKPALNREMKVF